MASGVHGVTLPKHVRVGCSGWRLEIRNVLHIIWLSRSKDLSPGQPFRLQWRYLTVVVLVWTLVKLHLWGEAGAG